LVVLLTLYERSLQKCRPKGPPISCVDEPAGEVHFITVAAIVSLQRVYLTCGTFPPVRTENTEVKRLPSGIFDEIMMGIP
jgi:hypothetical protein